MKNDIFLLNAIFRIQKRNQKSCTIQMLRKCIFGIQRPFFIYNPEFLNRTNVIEQSEQQWNVLWNISVAHSVFVIQHAKTPFYHLYKDDFSCEFFVNRPCFHFGVSSGAGTHRTPLFLSFLHSLSRRKGWQRKLYVSELPLGKYVCWYLYSWFQYYYSVKLCSGIVNTTWSICFNNNLIITYLLNLTHPQNKK